MAVIRFERRRDASRGDSGQRLAWTFPCNGTTAEQWNFTGPEL
jgi:hypothetical protein